MVQHFKEVVPRPVVLPSVKFWCGCCCHIPQLKKLWDVTEIMKEYVTLTEYPSVIGKNVGIILDTCFKAVA